MRYNNHVSFYTYLPIMAYQATVVSDGRRPVYLRNYHERQELYLPTGCRELGAIENRCN